MVKVKGFGTTYWMLVSSVQKYCPWKSVLVDFQCALAHVCGRVWFVSRSVVWHGAGKDSFASPQWTAGEAVSDSRMDVRRWESTWLNLNKRDTIVIVPEMTDRVKVKEDRHKLPTMPRDHLGCALGCAGCTLTFSFAVIFKRGIFNKAWKINKQGHSVKD